MMGALATKSLPSRANKKANDQNVAAHNIDGEIVLIDTTIGRLVGKPLCLVIREDGSYGIERAWNSIRWWHSRRHGYYDVKDHPESKDGNASIPCTILGRVIGPEPMEHYEAESRIDRLAHELSAAIRSEFGGDYIVTIQSGGRIEYRWATPEAA